jgi:hypothetical protein
MPFEVRPRRLIELTEATYQRAGGECLLLRRLKDLVNVDKEAYPERRLPLPPLRYKCYSRYTGPLRPVPTRGVGDRQEWLPDVGCPIRQPVRELGRQGELLRVGDTPSRELVAQLLPHLLSLALAKGRHPLLWSSSPHGNND